MTLLYHDYMIKYMIKLVIYFCNHKSEISTAGHLVIERALVSQAGPAFQKPMLTILQVFQFLFEINLFNLFNLFSV